MNLLPFPIKTNWLLFFFLLFISCRLSALTFTEEEQAWIAANPEIIFFDEPTTGLDPIMADVINDLIVDCVKDLGATTLSITHDMASARKIADNVAMIYQGRIVWHGPVEELDHSGNDYVDQFIHGRADGPITEDSKLMHEAA